MTTGIRAALLGAALFCAPPAVAEITLSLPIGCTLGESCYIQQFTDRDPSPGASDHRCGPLSYDGHKGTDFALPDRAAMRAGVEVRAAAPGVVRGTRDEMPDIPRSAPDAPDITGTECGNGLVIRHADGWETQYCHMMLGSLAVRPGETVERGQTLGRVGLSGDTDFPHLHLSVRHDGAVVDPFAPGDPACDADPGPGLWDQPIGYTPGGLIGAGFAAGVPSYDAIRDGRAAAGDLDTGAPALVLWGFAFGGRTGDAMRLTLTGPDGEIVDHTAPLDKAQAQFFRAAGKRRPASGWPAGRYEGRIALIRDGSEIDRRNIGTTLD